MQDLPALTGVGAEDLLPLGHALIESLAQLRTISGLARFQLTTDQGQPRLKQPRVGGGYSVPAQRVEVRGEYTRRVETSLGHAAPRIARRRTSTSASHSTSSGTPWASSLRHDRLARADGDDVAGARRYVKKAMNGNGVDYTDAPYGLDDTRRATGRHDSVRVRLMAVVAPVGSAQRIWPTSLL